MSLPLVAIPWPGNVRELQNRIKRAVVVSQGGRISAEALELSPPDDLQGPESLQEVRDRAERQAIENAMRLAGKNVSRAARFLEISRPKLYDRLRYHKMRR